MSIETIEQTDLLHVGECHEFEAIVYNENRAVFKVRTVNLEMGAEKIALAVVAAWNAQAAALAAKKESA